MPILIPTPDEVGRMSWRARQAWQRRMPAVLAEANRSASMVGAADFDADDPHAWSAFYGPDPDWQEHQRVLAEAIR